jgi:hypothetical protein
MRLLHTKDLRIQQFSTNDVPKYAIFSHTWEEEEVTFQDIERQTSTRMKGYPKLQNCCKRAAEDGYSWIWVDTCCIDKTSSAELSEAINSMFSWYKSSLVCYAYLADIQDVMDLDKSRWFTRGWTLQELIAPRHLILFDSMWREIGSKQSLLNQISSITGIPNDLILGKSPMSYNIAQRMSWASTRQTTREEDMAYCLMGLFNVHMPPIYGEGSEKAFIRLQGEILRQTSDQTLFLWTPTHEPYNQGLLANSPMAFCTHYDCFSWLPDVEKAPQNPFDPYSFFKPLSSRPSKVSFATDESDRPCLRKDTEAKDQALFPASLGPSGLHIPLLSNIGIPGYDAKLTSDDRRLVCLDIMVASPDFRQPILLILEPDMGIDYVGGFIPDRLGDMRRVSCRGEDSGYFVYPFRNFSFERTVITVSQISPFPPYSGPPVRFMFDGQETEALVGEVMLLKPGGSTNILSSPNRPFNSSRGAVSVQHSCPECDRKGGIMLCFGIRGPSPDPWCCFLYKHAAQLSDSSVLDLCQDVELLNARADTQPSHYMACQKRAFAKIWFAGNEDCFFISIAITSLPTLV